MGAVMSSHYIFFYKNHYGSSDGVGGHSSSGQNARNDGDSCNGGYGHLACSDGGRNGGRHDGDGYEVGGGDSGDQVAAVPVMLVVLGAVMMATVVVRSNRRSGGPAGHSEGGHSGSCFEGLRF